MPTTKINKNKKSMTRKKKIKLIEAATHLTPEQREIVCKKSANTYNTFEDKVEEEFIKNNMNIVSTSFNLEKQIIADLKKAVNTKNIQPQDDYYSYINDRWISDYELTEEQKYIVQVDDFRLVQDKVYRELAQMLDNYVTNSSTKNTKMGKCVKDAYTAAKGWNTDEQLRRSCAEFVKYVDKLRADKSSLWAKLAASNRNEITSWGSPFIWSINPDEKNPKVYKCYLEPPQVTLLDVDVYFEDDKDSEEEKKYKKRYKSKYFRYLHDMFTLCFGENHEFNIKDIFDTELELLTAMACTAIPETDPDGYNLVTGEEALSIFGFNWKEFCKALGFTLIPKDFVTSNVNYLLC